IRAGQVTGVQTCALPVLPKMKNFHVSTSFPNPPPVKLTKVTDLVNIQRARKESYVDRALCQRRNRDAARGPRRAETVGHGGRQRSEERRVGKRVEIGGGR